MAKPIQIIVPGHEWTYKELSNSMKDALNEYGFDAKIFYDESTQYLKDFNIYIAGKGDPPIIGDYFIFFETDHIDTPLRREKRPIPYKSMTRSLHWCDYKKDLRDENIYYCPIGYSKHFDTNIKREDLRDNFHMGRSGVYGYRNIFRAKYNLWTTPTPIAGEERDNIIVTSKININSQLYPDYWFAPLHASLIIHKGKLLMQEDYGRNEFNWYEPYLIPFTNENFEEKYNYWISHDKERKEFEAFIYKEVKEKHPFKKYFYEAMGDLLEAYI